MAIGTEDLSPRDDEFTVQPPGGRTMIPTSAPANLAIVLRKNSRSRRGPSSQALLYPTCAHLAYR